MSSHVHLVPEVDPPYSRSTPYLPMIPAGLSAYPGSESTAIPALIGGNLYLGNSPLLDQAVTRVMAPYAVIVGLVHSHRSGLVLKSADGDGS